LRPVAERVAATPAPGRSYNGALGRPARGRLAIKRPADRAWLNCVRLPSSCRATPIGLGSSRGPLFAASPTA